MSGLPEPNGYLPLYPNETSGLHTVFSDALPDGTAGVNGMPGNDQGGPAKNNVWRKYLPQNTGEEESCR